MVLTCYVHKNCRLKVLKAKCHYDYLWYSCIHIAVCNILQVATHQAVNAVENDSVTSESSCTWQVAPYPGSWPRQEWAVLTNKPKMLWCYICLLAVIHIGAHYFDFEHLQNAHSTGDVREILSSLPTSPNGTWVNPIRSSGSVSILSWFCGCLFLSYYSHLTEQRCVSIKYKIHTIRLIRSLE